ncbi:MAG: DNA recombination protein RmuC [Planctomycetes bacterium]|nr:DNA recombination protein RmuC [Planctomycetota bacterium]
MDPSLALLIGLLAGAGICGLFVRRRLHQMEARQRDLRTEMVETSQKYDQASAQIGEEKMLRGVAQAQLDAATNSLEERAQTIREQAQALEQLRTSHHQQLLNLGDQLGEKFRHHADASLKKQETDFLVRADQRLKPLDASLELLRKRTEDLEKARSVAYGSLGKQLEDLSQATSKLRSQSESLATALRGSSKARGRWGETTLRNLVEIAGLVEYCDFFEQTTTGDGSARPDLLVRLPGKEFIPIDAKVPLAAYLDAMEAPTQEQRTEHLKTHARDLRQHVRTLGSKDYARGIEGGIDFTVMYLPGDHFLEAAFRFHPNLQDEALAKKVLIATPVTLLALLKTVQLVWRNESVAQNAQKIRDAGLELHSRARVFSDHLSKVGRGLDQAVRSYNSACSSFNSRLMPKARDMEKLTVLSQEAQSLQPLKEATRPSLGLPEQGADADD